MRIRTIKPSFFTDDEVAELQPMARILFIGLWCAADREGRLKDRPKRLKAELFPYDDVNIDEFLTALVAQRFITRYEVDGVRYIQIHNFLKHQRPNRKELPSTIPSCPEQALEQTKDGSRTNPARARARAKEGKGRGKEGKGREERSAADAAGKLSVPVVLDTLSEASSGRVATKPYDQRHCIAIAKDVIPQLERDGVTVEDLQAAGRYISTWPAHMAVDVAWIATTGKLAGAIAKAKAIANASTKQDVSVGYYRVEEEDRMKFTKTGDVTDEF